MKFANGCIGLVFGIGRIIFDPSRYLLFHSALARMRLAMAER
jgi:hypothetical protein